MALHYKEEHTAPTGSQKTLRKMLALIPALVVAVLCYSVTVYAWFSASIVNTGNVIQTTTYELKISVTSPDGTNVEPVEGVYHLADGKNTIILTAAKDGASTGYCVIRTNDALTGTRAHLRAYHNGNPNAAVNFQLDITNRDYSLTTNVQKESVPYSGIHCKVQDNILEQDQSLPIR